MALAKPHRVPFRNLMHALGRSRSPLVTGLPALAFSPLAVLIVWAIYSAFRVAVLPLIGTDPFGPDDYTRMLEMRDLLAGQNWYDVSQYRMNAPEGASMHWSRIVDIPLAAMALFCGLFTSPLAAEKAAMIAVPLLYLLPVLFALQAIMKRFGFTPLAVIFGLVILPLFPLLPGNFAPLRIDHHAPQAVLGLICGALLLSRSRRAAIASGFLAAAWMNISLEGLPLVAVLAGLYGLRYWICGRKELAYFLGSLALAAPALSIATRPLAAFSLPYCDILMPGHMAAFAGAAALSALFIFAPAQAQMKGRLIALLVIPIVCAPLAWFTLGTCASDPFSQLDPTLVTYWHGLITEGLPIWRQPISVAFMLIWTMALIIIGWRIAVKNAAIDTGRSMDWLTYGLFALAAAAYSFWLMRAGVVAQLLAIPFAAFLLGHFLPKARRLRSAVPRIIATLACFLAVTPTLASGLGKQFDPFFASDAARARGSAQASGLMCDYGRLAGLEQGKVFAPLDAGPQILGKTDHTIVMASYHRNQTKMVEVISAYVGNVDDARAIISANDAEYLIACSTAADLALYRTADEANFANAVLGDTPPQWLEIMPGFEVGSLRVFRVK